MDNTSAGIIVRFDSVAVYQEDVTKYVDYGGTYEANSAPVGGAIMGNAFSDPSFYCFPTVSVLCAPWSEIRVSGLTSGSRNHLFAQPGCAWCCDSHVWRPNLLSGAG